MLEYKRIGCEKMTGLEILNKFMEVNMHIKNTLVKMAPDATCNYSEESKIKYIDKLLHYTDILKDDFMIINKLYPNLISKDFVNKIFNNLNEKIENFSYRYDSLNDFFNRYYADVSDIIINDVNENFCGYADPNLFETLNKCKTINEILHTIHSYITQTEYIYESIPNIWEKELKSHSKVALKGALSPLAKMIYDNLSDEIEAGFIDILSATDKQIFIMARDLGHALTIDVSVDDNNNVWVKYYIPKLCNMEMIKNLRGIKKIVSINDILGWATGDFHCSLDEFIDQFNNFITKVPTDKDMPRL